MLFCPPLERLAPSSGQLLRHSGFVLLRVEFLVLRSHHVTFIAAASLFAYFPVVYLKVPVPVIDIRISRTGPFDR